MEVFALTLATISLNVAEVFGPFFGAWIFSFWGLQATYYVPAAGGMVLVSRTGSIFKGYTRSLVQV